MAISNTVTGNLLYFVPPADGSKGWQNINASVDTGERSRNFTRVPHDLEIENLRGKEDSVTIDTAGFQFYKRAAKHTSFANDEAKLDCE